MGLFETVASSLFHMLTFIFFVLILLLMLYICPFTYALCLFFIFVQDALDVFFFGLGVDVVVDGKDRRHTTVP